MWSIVKKFVSGICSFTGAFLSFISVVLIYAMFWMTPRYDDYGETGRFATIVVWIIICLSGVYAIARESIEDIIDKIRGRKVTKCRHFRKPSCKYKNQDNMKKIINIMEGNRSFNFFALEVDILCCGSCEIFERKYKND
jgi:hypothetical protein